jgi:hypothetical protein
MRASLRERYRAIELLQTIDLGLAFTRVLAALQKSFRHLAVIAAPVAKIRRVLAGAAYF